MFTVYWIYDKMLPINQIHLIAFPLSVNLDLQLLSPYGSHFVGGFPGFNNKIMKALRRDGGCSLVWKLSTNISNRRDINLSVNILYTPIRIPSLTLLYLYLLQVFLPLLSFFSFTGRRMVSVFGTLWFCYSISKSLPWSWGLGAVRFSWPRPPHKLQVQEEETSASEPPTPAQDVQAERDFPPHLTSSDQPPPAETLPPPVKTHSGEASWAL